MPWHATGIEIGTLVACRALHADGTETACASHYEWLVRVAIVVLQRTVAGRVAINASGMLDYFTRFSKEGDRSLLLVRDV
jgi:hypothetical protein